MKRRAPVNDLVLRLFDDAWQSWEFVGGAPRRIDAEPAGEVRRILAVPARQVIALPLWIDGADAALAPETLKLELEVRGLLPRAQGLDGVAVRLHPHESRMLAVAGILPPELPAGVPAAEAFEPSPFLLALARDAATLWREGEDLVVAFTRGDEVVYWETVDRGVGADGLRAWLGMLSLRLRGEGVIAAPPRIVSWVEGIPAARIAPAGCAPEADAPEAAPGQPSLRLAKLSWQPVSAVQARAQRVARERIKRLVFAVGACYLAVAAALALYFGFLRWQMARLGGEAAGLRAEVEKFQPIAKDWPRLAPTVTPATYPLEILRGAVEGMPSKGVRLILFRVEDGRITVNGEADTFQMATDYYNALAAADAFRGFNLQSDTPQMKANNSASFNITGTAPAP